MEEGKKNQYNNQVVDLNCPRPSRKSHSRSRFQRMQQLRKVYAAGRTPINVCSPISSTWTWVRVRCSLRLFPRSSSLLIIVVVPSTAAVELTELDAISRYVKYVIWDGLKSVTCRVSGFSSPRLGERTLIFQPWCAPTPIEIGYSK
jgi:hypothetical protein